MTAVEKAIFNKSVYRLSNNSSRHPQIAGDIPFG
jgi:hypothetical protein